MSRTMQLLRKLSAEGVPPDSRVWVDAILVRPLNTLIDTLQGLLNRAISLPENTNTQVVVLDVVAPATWTASTYLRFNSTLSGRCIGIVPLKVALLDGAGKETTSLLSDVAATPADGTIGATEWDEQRPTTRDGVATIRIRRQSGLTAGYSYRLTLLAIGE